MKKAGIKTAILIPALAVLIAGIVIMSAVTGVLSSNASKTLTSQLIEATVNEHANDLQALCGGIYETVAAVTPIIEKYIDPSYVQNVSDPRGDVIDILSKVLMPSDKIIAIWTCWEPDAFDGKDREYADDSFYDATGRFVPYLYKDGNGYKINALTDYEDPVAGEYYQGARNSGKPYMTDPYSYQVGDKEIPICSLAIPITRNGKVAGVVGVDIDLQGFMALMNSVNILDDGYLFTLSPGGLLISHPKKEMQMTSYTATWMNNYKAQFEDLVKNGGRFSVSAYSDVTKTNMDFSGTSVKIGDTEHNWIVCGIVPQKTVNASSVSLLWAIVMIGGALIAVVGATIFFLVSSRLKGLSGLTSAAQKIALGDIELSGLNVGTDATRNEITILERAFGKMAAGIKQQADVLSQIAEGDYSMTVPIRSEKDVMNRAINNVLENTNQTLSKINVAAGQVSIGSKQIADNAQSLARGAAEQASSIEELSATINEVNSKTNENAKITREASALSSVIKEKAEKGSAQMNHMMQAVSEINEASTQIEKVIKAIDDIAFQTNILALNAAVEAARAGVHGKGFAVVAEEVRNLAAKSAASANDTSLMIENSKEKANLGLAIADETASSLKEIIDGINRSADIVVQIERATVEQATAISQINAGIDQVAQVIQQNSASSEESAAASDEMNGQSDMLTQLTSQFILKSTGFSLQAP